jgi:hypothetical protein
MLRSMLADQHEQQLAYLYFQCGLSPREMVRFCLQEFCAIHEMYRLRHRIMERLLRNADQLRRRLEQQDASAIRSHFSCRGQHFLRELFSDVRVY